MAIGMDTIVPMATTNDASNFDVIYFSCLGTDEYSDHILATR